MTPALAQFVLALPCGFLTDDQLPALVALDRLTPVLVRCEGGRFTCPAQDAAHFIALVERDGREHVRDVSICASVLAEARIARDHPLPEAALARLQAHVKSTLAAPLAGCPPLPEIKPLSPLAKPIPHRATRTVRLSDSVMFNEGDCGGAFDGRQVTSDAEGNL